MQGYTLATQRACYEYITSDLLLSMCTSHMVPKRLIKIWETLVYLYSASTWLQLNSFSWNLSLCFLTQTRPPNWNGIRSWKPSSGLSLRLWLLGRPIIPPALSFFPVLFSPMWHHAGKQQHFVWHQFAHIYSWAPMSTLPNRGWHTTLHTQGPQFWTSS